MIERARFFAAKRDSRKIVRPCIDIAVRAFAAGNGIANAIHHHLVEEILHCSQKLERFRRYVLPIGVDDAAWDLMSSATPQFEDGYDSDDRPRLRLRDDAAAEDVDDAVEQAVEQCRRGEEAGRRAVFELFHGRIYRLIVRMIGRNDAADVTQDVFLRVYEKIEDFKGEARFGTWLYRIAVNECLQRLRRQSNCRMIPIANDPTDPALRHVEKTDNEELIDRAMQLLEPELRSVFLLREFEGLSYAEISLAMNLAAGTVASRLNRARLRLRDILIDLGWEP